MPSITPFKIAIPDEKLQRLKQKLELSDFPNEDTEIDEPWARGAPISDIKRLAHHWQNTFDWRKVEEKLNEYPQYITPIEVEGFDTYDIHFIHQPSTVKTAIPLLFLHGWPGSFVEVTKMLPLLIQGGKDFPAFHVVAPSLIDFGFSSANKKKNFHIDQHAVACHKLMLALGYDEYVVQGGDIGSLVARSLALQYGPRHCKAHHLNVVAPAEPTATSHPALHAQIQATPLTTSELAGLARSAHFSKQGMGYYSLQSTRPLTLSYSLTSSPISLLSWIYEKLHDWSDAYAWTDDEVLTWVSIYYFSSAGAGASSSIFYANEHREPVGAFAASQVYVDVPLGVARFPKELILLPKLWNRTLGPVVWEREYERGGHFAAWECPEVLVGDLRGMFGRGGGAFGVVKGGEGYE